MFEFEGVIEMGFLISALSALLLTCAVSLDAFVASFAYGTNKIKIPFRSILVINIVCSSILGIALVGGCLIGQYIPDMVTKWFCFAILSVISFTKFFECLIKKWINKSKSVTPKKEFSFLNFKFCIQLLGDPTMADSDKSKTLSSKEAFALAVSLSLDGFAVGIGTGMVDINIFEVFLFSLLTGMLAVILGQMAGYTIAKKTNLNLSWLSGTILLILAISKVL